MSWGDGLLFFFRFWTQSDFNCSPIISVRPFSQLPKSPDAYTANASSTYAAAAIPIWINSSIFCDLFWIYHCMMALTHFIFRFASGWPFPKSGTKVGHEEKCMNDFVWLFISYTSSSDCIGFCSGSTSDFTSATTFSFDSVIFSTGWGEGAATTTASELLEVGGGCFESS